MAASSWWSDWLKASTNALLAPYTPFSVSGEIATTETVLATAQGQPVR